MCSTGGRTKAACCTVQKAPPKPASCSTNLCKKLPGFCPNDDDDESANGFTKRDLALFKTTDPKEWHALEERGGSDHYIVVLGYGEIMLIIAIAYPAIGSLFGGRNAAQILREFFRLIPGYCTGPSIQTGPINPGKTDLNGFQTEHPIDVSMLSFESDFHQLLTDPQRQVMKGYVQASFSGILPSGQAANLPAIPRHFYTNQWDVPNSLLAARPAVGSPSGAQPVTPNDRVMEGFGSNNWPGPFMAVDAQINGAKGRIMNLRPATGLDTITTLANTAVRDDDQGAADELLQAIRVVSHQALSINPTQHQNR